jgi:hypothetical protein
MEIIKAIMIVFISAAIGVAIGLKAYPLINGRNKLEIFVSPELKKDLDMISIYFDGSINKISVFAFDKKGEPMIKANALMQKAIMTKPGDKF